MRRALALAVLLGAGGAVAQVRSFDDHAPISQPLNWPTWGAPTRVPMLRSWVQGWALSGSNPGAYEVRCSEVPDNCAVPMLRTRATAGRPLGTGMLTHSENALPWRGHRVVVRAELKAGSIGGWAGLQMLVEGPGGVPLAFDNMQNRPIRGTSAFEQYRVVLDVPLEAERVTIGVLLHGPGAVFIRELQFEEADPDEPVTDLIGPLKAQANAESKPAAGKP